MNASSLRQLLLPLVPAYRAGLALREACLRSGREVIRHLPSPVVSIGNLSTGGTGKTPLTIALAQALLRRGVAVDVLSRGYGRRSALPLLVDPHGSAQQFGDEPLLIAREAGVPVYVAAERYEAGILAEREAMHGSVGQRLGPAKTAAANDEWALAPEEVLKGHGFSRAERSTKNEGALAPEGIHLLDDGFQHRQLARDLDIVIVNRRDWRDFLLPAGNLREPVEALRRAHVIAIPADEPALEIAIRNKLGFTGPIWRLRRKMDVPPIAGPLVAFCGIAHPRQFFAGLESAGLQIASRIAFRDHHKYVDHDLDCLRDAARSVNAVSFITTEKDLVRLSPIALSLTAVLPLHTAKLRIEIEDQPAAIDWLVAHLTSPEPNSPAPR